MLYRFSKRVIVDSYNNGFVNTGKHQLFSVYDGETMIGEFYYNSAQSFFYYGDVRVKIARVGDPLFSRSPMSLIDQSTDTVIGKYPGTGWRAVGKKEVLWLHGMKYTFRKIKPAVKYSLFKRDTWDQYRYRVSNGVDEMIYSFKLDIPSSVFSSRFINNPFEGCIEVSGDNKMVMFASFFYIWESVEEGFRV